MSCNTIKRDNSNLTRVWMLVEFNQFDKEYLSNKKAYLDLKQSNIASSKMGCNQLSFEYTIKSNSEIKFSTVIATRMFCNDMQLENDFSKAIVSINHFEINGHQLILTSKEGIKLVFIAQDWD